VLPPIAVGIKAAAQMVGFSPNTIRRQIASGRLQTAQIGRRRLVPVEALRELLKERTER
jgi:excisionase family DNA binding protein